MIDTFLRKAPLNPDAFTNPALHHHYSVLMASAFGTPVPAYNDTILPDYDLIHEVRSSASYPACQRSDPGVERGSAGRPTHDACATSPPCAQSERSLCAF